MDTTTITKPYTGKHRRPGPPDRRPPVLRRILRALLGRPYTGKHREPVPPAS